MKKKLQQKKNNLVIYQARNGEIKFRGDFSHDTIWATQKQIAEVFEIERSVITKHIRNIFKDGELNKKSTCAIFAQVQKEGSREVLRNVEFYNLDMIISVGYRVDSKTATEFRKWATKILKQHITKGYTINPRQIKENYKEFFAAVERIQKLLPAGNVIATEDILELVKSFADTYRLQRCYTT